jgi:pyruvate dehydrogenase E1 component
MKKSDALKIIEQRLLWLSHWMIHNANHIRPKADGIKVGGHQASSASMVSIMTALYFSALRPEDRVAVKPHASPVFHAMQYLMGNQTREKLEASAGLAARSPIPAAPRTWTTWISPPAPSGLAWGSRPLPRWCRTSSRKELGEASRSAAWSRWWAMRNWTRATSTSAAGRLEERPAQLLVDHRLQPPVARRGRARGPVHAIEKIFEAFGWDVVPSNTAPCSGRPSKEPGGKALRDWIDACPNALYSRSPSWAAPCGASG